MIKLKDLHYAAIEEKPRHIDWSVDGNWERYDFWEASKCEHCGTKVFGSNYADCPKCGQETHIGDGPMMNFGYPLPTFDQDSESAAHLIAHLPVCLVWDREDDTWYLALTGGGIDLSWEICEAYVRLGYLPPVHFADLPHMATRTRTSHRLVLAAMRKSVRTLRNRLTQDLYDLRRTSQWLNEHTGKEKA